MKTFLVVLRDAELGQECIQGFIKAESRKHAEEQLGLRYFDPETGAGIVHAYLSQESQGKATVHLTEIKEIKSL